MRTHLALLGLLGLYQALSLGALAAEPAGNESCDQIRAQIGTRPPADPELLAKLSQRQECRFSPEEVYKAAYGDKPVPREAAHTHRHREHDEGGDDD